METLVVGIVSALVCAAVIDAVWSALRPPQIVYIQTEPAPHRRMGCLPILVFVILVLIAVRLGLEG